MNEAKVLGIKKIHFSNQDTGELISGSQVWLSMPTPDPAWAGGVEVFKVWCAAGSQLSAVADRVRPGDSVILSTTRTGKVCDMVLA